MDERIKQIAEHYGFIHQLFKLQEEISELNMAMAKLQLSPYDDRTFEDTQLNFVEEIADVQIMLAQIVHLMGVEKKVAGITDYKLNRQIKRIKNEKQKNI